MAVRQYIGARYVIKIYENSVDPASAEWEQGNFEPLVLVTWQNGSYLSKKEVPGSVGNPANNPTYWVQTGFYNGQIASLQSQIDDINNNKLPAVTAAIDDINNTKLPAVNSSIQALSDKVNTVTYSKLNGRRIVIITDSYGEVTGNFLDQMQAACPELDSGTNFFSFAYGGAGFVSTTGFSWKEKFIDSGDINTVTTPETITDILVLGGSNDRSADISINDIKTAAHTFYDLLVAAFPNAVIYVGYIGYSVNYLAGNYAPSVKQAYQDCGFYGYRPIAHANSWLHYTGYITDNVHPNANGSKLIANGVLNVLLGGGEDDVFNNRPTGVPVTMESGFTSSGLASRLYSWHYGHRSALKLIPAAFMFDSAALLFNGTWQKFATIGDSFLYGANDNYHVRVGAISCNYNSKEYTIPVLIKLFNSGLYIQCYPCDELKGSTAINLTYVQVLFDGFEADDIFM